MRRPVPELGGSAGPEGPSATQYPWPGPAAAVPTACALLPAALPEYFAVPVANTEPSLATNHRPVLFISRASPTMGLDARRAGTAPASPKLKMRPSAVAIQ